MNYPCFYCHHDTRDQPRVILTMKFVPFVFWEDDCVENNDANSKVERMRSL